jgi:hypothetical protein
MQPLDCEVVHADVCIVEPQPPSVRVHLPGLWCSGVQSQHMTTTQGKWFLMLHHQLWVAHQTPSTLLTCSGSISEYSTTDRAPSLDANTPTCMHQTSGKWHTTAAVWARCAMGPFLPFRRGRPLPPPWPPPGPPVHGSSPGTGGPPGVQVHCQHSSSPVPQLLHSKHM